MGLLLRPASHLSLVLGAIAVCFAPFAHATTHFPFGDFDERALQDTETESTSAMSVPDGFRYLGDDYNKIYMNLNGHLTFLTEYGRDDPFPGGFPIVDVPPMISAFWTDIDPLAQNPAPKVYLSHRTDDESKNQFRTLVGDQNLVMDGVIVATWENVRKPGADAADAATFQISLGFLSGVGNAQPRTAACLSVDDVPTLNANDMAVIGFNNLDGTVGDFYAIDSNGDSALFRDGSIGSTVEGTSCFIVTDNVDVTDVPTTAPSRIPTASPTGMPTTSPSSAPSKPPTESPTFRPSTSPTVMPSDKPSSSPMKSNSISSGDDSGGSDSGGSESGGSDSGGSESGGSDSGGSESGGSNSGGSESGGSNSGGSESGGSSSVSGSSESSGTADNSGGSESSGTADNSGGAESSGTTDNSGGSDSDEKSDSQSPTSSPSQSPTTTPEFDLVITEIFPFDNPDVTGDWFEITNFGDGPWNAMQHRKLYFEDKINPNSPDTPVEIMGIDSIESNETVIVVIGNSSAVTDFINVWGPILGADMPKVAYVDGNSLKDDNGGDAVNIFLEGDPLTKPIASASYPKPEDDNVGQSWDALAGSWSVADTDGAKTRTLSGRNGVLIQVVTSAGTSPPVNVINPQQPDNNSSPTSAPTSSPVETGTDIPTTSPTTKPTAFPSLEPTLNPTKEGCVDDMEKRFYVYRLVKDKRRRCKWLREQSSRLRDYMCNNVKQARKQCREMCDDCSAKKKKKNKCRNKDKKSFKYYVDERRGCAWLQGNEHEARQVTHCYEGSSARRFCKASCDRCKFRPGDFEWTNGVGVPP